MVRREGAKLTELLQLEKLDGWMKTSRTTFTQKITSMMTKSTSNTTILAHASTQLKRGSDRQLREEQTRADARMAILVIVHVSSKIGHRWSVKIAEDQATQQIDAFTGVRVATRSTKRGRVR